MKQWAEREGVHYVTAYRWFREGKLPVPARRVGRLILVEPSAVERPTGAVAVYARVSSAGQYPGLDRQVARVTAWATGRDRRPAPAVGPPSGNRWLRARGLLMLHDSQRSDEDRLGWAQEPRQGLGRKHRSIGRMG